MLKVRWTQSATVQFGRMLTFYNVRNGNSRYSRTIVKMVSESLKLIAKFPQMYRAVDAEEIVNIRVFQFGFTRCKKLQCLHFILLVCTNCQNYTVSLQ